MTENMSKFIKLIKNTKNLQFSSSSSSEVILLSTIKPPNGLEKNDLKENVLLKNQPKN